MEVTDLHDVPEDGPKTPWTTGGRRGDLTHVSRPSRPLGCPSTRPVGSGVPSKEVRPSASPLLPEDREWTRVHRKTYQTGTYRVTEGRNGSRRFVTPTTPYFNSRGSLSYRTWNEERVLGSRDVPPVSYQERGRSEVGVVGRRSVGSVPRGHLPCGTGRCVGVLSEDLPCARTGTRHACETGVHTLPGVPDLRHTTVGVPSRSWLSVEFRTAQNPSGTGSTGGPSRRHQEPGTSVLKDTLYYYTDCTPESPSLVEVTSHTSSRPWSYVWVLTQGGPDTGST